MVRLSQIQRCLAARVCIAMAAAALGWTPLVAAPAPVPIPASREYEIKAAALYDIIAFTEWPATSFGTAEAPLVVGIWGVGPVASLLGNAMGNETWRGRRVVLKQL